MNDRDSVIYIIVVYAMLVFLSRPIRYLLGAYFAEPGILLEAKTFIIVFILDAIAMYVMVKLGHDGGIAEAFNLVFLKAFFFALFYFLGVVMIYYTIEGIADIANFIGM